MATPEQNKQLVADMYAAMNKNVLGLMDKYWMKDMVWEGPAGIGTMHGLDEFEYDYRKAFIRAFPDKHATDLVRISEGDWVAAAGIQETTFEESWLGIPPTKKPIVMRYMDFWHIVPDPETGEQKLKENLVLIDILGVLEQAGYDVKKVLKYIGSKPPAFFDQTEE